MGADQPTPNTLDARSLEQTQSAAKEAAIAAAGPVAFAALTTEPHTGVGVVSSRGQVLYLNRQATTIFHGADAKPSDFVGRFWQDHMPTEWTRERLRILATIGVSGKPVLMRTIWRDHQHFTWISPIERPASTEEGDGAAEGPLAGEELFLTITRRAVSDEDAERLMPEQDQIEEIDSGVMRLKALDCLSSRELQVLALLGQGLSMGEAARVLRLSEKTIDNHRTSIHQKLRLHDRATLVKVASRCGLSLADADRKRV
jgi:DNA-binding CsgD family transcriptional regulator